MCLRLLCAALLLCPLLAFGQYARHEKRLIEKVAAADGRDAEQAKALQELAEFYFIYKSEKKADSVLNLQLRLAELTAEPELLEAALFSNAISSIGSWTSMATFDNALRFLDHSLRFAQREERVDLEAIARIRKATLLRKRGKLDDALREASMAMNVLTDAENDSLSSVLYLELGDIHLGLGEAVNAYRHYNRSYDLAYSNKIIPLLSKTYHHLAILHASLRDKQTAKDLLLKSVALNKDHQLPWGRLEDYIDLARITDDKHYILEAEKLADSLGSLRHQLFSHQLMLAYLMVKEKDSRQAIAYLEHNPDLKQVYLNLGPANHHLNMGNIYRYSGQPDSALYYYEQAAPELTKSFDPSKQMSLHMEMGECHYMLQSHEAAIRHFTAALDLARQAKDLASRAVILDRLSYLQSQTGQYEAAFAASQDWRALTDTLNQKGDERQMLLLDLEREEKRHEQDMAEKEKKEAQEHEIQYIIISVAVAVIFLFLFVFGMFPVSHLAIKILNFFAFVCLFELFVVIIDTYLHHRTHGAPMKIWGIKIFIIAVLLPTHHWIEHLMLRFLESKKMARFREQLNIRRLWQLRVKVVQPEHPTDKPIATTEADKGTAEKTVTSEKKFVEKTQSEPTTLHQ